MGNLTSGASVSENTNLASPGGCAQFIAESNRNQAFKLV